MTQLKAYLIKLILIAAFLFLAVKCISSKVDAISACSSACNPNPVKVFDGTTSSCVCGRPDLKVESVGDIGEFHAIYPERL